MLKPLPKPQVRSPLRMALGQGMVHRQTAGELASFPESLCHGAQQPRPGVSHASHRTPLLRQLKGVDMWLQHNKAGKP